MALEYNVKSYRKQVAQLQRKEITNVSYTEEEALELVRTHCEKKLAEESTKGLGPPKVEIALRNKEYLRQLKKYYHELVSDILMEMNISIEGHRTNESFIQVAVAEFAGYSVLEDAFNDPKVTDIFVISWDCIFIEKNGEIPVKYEKTFRDAKHLKITVDRLLREAEKEVNNGKSRIVDADIYGDRYCITAPSVSPRDYSITIRKHSESHITLEDVLRYKVMNQEIADFIGILLKGETNIVIAGITGSGKSTTLRALMDHYITKLGRRIVTCEDTRELFLANEHTLELVTVKNDDPSLAVPLEKLIVTALRLKPKYIAVGEVRGPEIMGMIEAAETGHSTLTTMHGFTWVNICNRAITKYMMAMPSLGVQAVSRIVGSAIDYVITQSDIPGIGRKITTITEISYDFDKDQIVGKSIYEYNYDTNDWDRFEEVGEEKLKKMRSRGVTTEEIQKHLRKKVA